METPAKRANTPTSGKKRKRPASISPRRGKKRLSLSEVRKHVNSATASQPTKRDDAGTSCKNPPRSIESFFAKAKPPRYTPCPVCSEEIKLSEINRHLDSGCLSKQESPAKGEEESVKQSSRKVADVRNDVKDKRTRRRLQNKFESSPLYQQSSSSLSSDDNQESCVLNNGLEGSEIPGTLGKEISIGNVLNQSKGADQDSEDAFVQSSDTSKPVKQNKRDKARSRLSLKKLRQRKDDSESNFESEEVHDVTKDAIRTESLSQSKKVTSPFFNHARKGSANIKSPGSAVRSSGQSEGTLSQNLHNASSDSAVESFRITPTRIYIPEKKSSQSTLNSVSPETKASTSSTSSQRGGSRNKISLTGSPSTSTGHDRGSRKIHRTPVRTKLFSDSGKPQVEPLPTQTSRFSKDYVSKDHRQSASVPSSELCTSSPIVDVEKGLTNGPGASSSPPSIPTSANGSYTSTQKSTSIEINKGLSSKGESAATSSLSTSHSSTPKKGSPYTSPAKSGTTATSPARSDTLGSPHKPREPYYIVNFKLILNAVLKNEFDAHLFDDEDHAQVSKFNSLSGPAQQLYVRLFQRKFTWFRVAKVDYPKISLNLKPLFTEMINAGLLITESSLDDLAVTLKLLMAPDLKQLAKDFKVGGSGQKGDMVEAIIKYSSRQRSFFSANMDKIVLKKAKKLLGSCVKLTKEPRTVFNRIIMLFSLVRQDLIEEEKGSSGQSALQTELLVNMGRMSYPAYTVFRTRSFFASKEDLLRYEVALQYENDIADALGINDFELADRLQATAMVTYKELAKDEQILKHDETLPEYLRCYSAGWVYTHVRYQGVEIRQKQRRYEEAVELLRALLEQKVYCPDRRGGWYDRLALNLDQHCKKQHEALDCIKDGMADPKVRVGHRLALQLRAQKILKSNKKQLSERADEFQFDDVLETPKVTIQGTVLPHHGPGVRNTFISSYQGPVETDEGIVVCSVEQVALEHYKQQGYTEGIHGEGTTYSTLIFVIFWDIVFHPNIPDVFCYPYQTAPLDLRTDHFYANRCDAIQRKLDEVREADEEQLAAMLEANWLEYEGDLCVGLSWEIFRDVEHAKGLLRCIGGKLLSAIAERILTNHRHCRAGRPDLTMWNPETKKFKLVEVKGPGDRLSQKQILWIDFFLRHGIEAEVCHVEGM
ncbi:fanconi-associated nuclease 1-like isoform X1 [Lytechinus variegatus]|uniref:fanconi-associated nuclease 1-like isoform X1 n=1 Tax=Lytechinus variegatus TaxID=7654 RepID=UPI001BB159AA|nr:fanconi-associated nuclease 1-like isoform X1 [Lytechinus variegatus]